MNDNMNSGANTQRITVSLPNYIYDRLVKQVPERQVSRFVAGLLEEKLLASLGRSTDPIDEFLKMRKKVPKLSYGKIRKAIDKGRE